MKLSFCTMGYLEYTTCEEAVRRIAKMGYDGIDFWAYAPHLDPYLYDKEERKQIRKLVEEVGLEISGLSVNAGTFGLHLNFSHSNPKIRQSTVQYYKKVLELAEDVGAPLINILSGGHKVYGTTLEQAWEWNKECIKEVLEEAEKRNTILALHTMTPGETEVMRTLDDCLRMIHEIGSERLKLILETSDQNATDPDLYSAVKKAAPHLAYVHINDNFGDWRGDIDLPPGRGNINWKMFIRALREIGYNGYLLVQVHNIGTRIDIDGWALDSLEFMRKLLAENNV